MRRPKKNHQPIHAGTNKAPLGREGVVLTGIKRVYTIQAMVNAGVINQ